MVDKVIILGKSANDWQADLKRAFRSGTIVCLVLAAIFFAILGRPYFTVGTTENGLVLRFGRHVRTLPPGLHWKLPWPIESVILSDVQQIRRITIGFRSPEAFMSRQQRMDNESKVPVPEESLMLTGDLNIIMVELAVQYRIKDAAAYLFNIREPNDDPGATLKDICEATLRRVIGDYGVDAPLTGGKAAIEDEIQEKAQELADQYKLGLLLTSVNLQDVQPPVEVQPSFKAVVTSKENKQTYINEALGYQNGEIPRAEGQAAGVINEASAYASERVLRAQGEVKKFSAILNEYRKAKDITRTRLYLESMEQTLGQLDITLVDDKLRSILPLLELGGPPTGDGEDKPLKREKLGLDPNPSDPARPYQSQMIGGQTQP